MHIKDHMLAVFKSAVTAMPGDERLIHTRSFGDIGLAIFNARLPSVLTATPRAFSYLAN